jgi:hypothetical protein
MLPRNALTFATLMRTRECALTAGSALKSSMTSDNFFRILTLALCAPEGRYCSHSGLFEESQLQTLSSITRVPLSAAASDSLQGRYVIVVVVRADDLRST